MKENLTPKTSEGKPTKPSGYSDKRIFINSLSVRLHNPPYKS
jgi:hypothetical protein